MLRIRAARLALLTTALLLACSAGHESPLDRAPTSLRVVSLAPHLTELAFAAGAGGRLVGVADYSDFPAAARSIPRVGDAFGVDFERLAGLAPDLVLAWDGGTPQPLIERLEAMGFEVLAIRIETLDDIPARVTELGRLAGEPARAEQRAREFRAAMDSLRGETAGGRGKRVFFQISLNPLFTVGGRHFISEMIELCGGENIFSDLDELAPAVSHEAVLDRRPELVLTDRHSLEQTRLLWIQLHEAVSVKGIDADLVTRPTLRVAQGARQICAAIADPG